MPSRDSIASLSAYNFMNKLIIAHRAIQKMQIITKL